MATTKHGRCRRGVRPAVGSIGRPGAGLRADRQRFWKAIAQGLPSEKAASAAGVSPAGGGRLVWPNGGVPYVPLSPLFHPFLSFSPPGGISFFHSHHHTLPAH